MVGIMITWNYLIDNKELFGQTLLSIALIATPMITEINALLTTISLSLGALLTIFLIIKTYIDIRQKLKK